jgi:Fe2+ or Zn2+ uptake regulation protein
MHITADDLLDALRAHGHRITAPRRAVCTVVAASHADHLDATEILAQIQNLGASADQSTVYRTLEALESAGILTHGHLGHRAAIYHLATEPPHQHLVCNECGKTLTLRPEEMAAWARAIEQSTGFEIDPNHFALTGRCGRCAGLPATG